MTNVNPAGSPTAKQVELAKNLENSGVKNTEQAVSGASNIVNGVASIWNGTVSVAEGALDYSAAFAKNTLDAACFAAKMVLNTPEMLYEAATSGAHSDKEEKAEEKPIPEPENLFINDPSIFKGAK